MRSVCCCLCTVFVVFVVLLHFTLLHHLLNRSHSLQQKQADVGTVQGLHEDSHVDKLKKKDGPDTASHDRIDRMIAAKHDVTLR